MTATILDRSESLNLYAEILRKRATRQPYSEDDFRAAKDALGFSPQLIESHELQVSQLISWERDLELLYPETKSVDSRRAALVAEIGRSESAIAQARATLHGIDVTLARAATLKKAAGDLRQKLGPIAGRS